MIKSLMFTLEDDKVRFTPDGKVAVLDIIAALTGSEEPGLIWDEMIVERPDALAYCEDFDYKDRIIKVVDRDGLAMIEGYLFDYMIDMWQKAG